ncbi:hypothetical protein GCM10010911_53670 [Paenibacillus nasutitermitis]|uniref:Laminin G domain-containing protein n=2 Tax=Paenibacillus nasutitermitis TaxID=1652958 RepID=A0A916ZCW4_9BACL|nr:hypothetical protein GCM10010911_53670 [Paenibacillus nasutitermitis]
MSMKGLRSSRICKLTLAILVSLIGISPNMMLQAHARIVPSDVVQEYVLNKTYNGTSDFTDKSGDLGSVSSLSQGSVLVRFKSGDLSATSKTLISASDTSVDSSHIRLSLETGTLRFEVVQNGNELTSIASTGSYNDGYWHVAVITVDSSGTNLYVDGVLNHSDASSAYFADVTALNGMWIGKHVDDSGSESYYSGGIERVALYNRALSEEEVQDVSDISLLTNIADQSTITQDEIHLEELNAVVGYLNGDTSPESGAIGNWGFSSPVALDYQNRSVGIDLQSSIRINKISLRDTDNSGRGSATTYALYESDDNITYTPISDFLFSASTEDGKLVHHLSFNDVTARYIKIHTFYSDAAYTFLLHPLQQSVTALGKIYSRFTNLRTTVGYLNNDTSPASGAIGNWGFSSPVAFDYQNRSVGIDLQSSTLISEVALQDTDNSGRGSAETYALYKSNDNITYTPISDFLFSTSIQNGKLVHHFSFNNVTARYIKIHTLYCDAAYTFLLHPLAQSVKALRSNDKGWLGLKATVGYLNEDTSPTTGVIGNWGFNSALAFDYKYRSVGIDFHSSRRVNEVDLWDYDNNARGSGANYELYMSNDNITYTLIPNVTFSSNTENGKLVHHFSFNGVTARYIKIHTLYSDLSYSMLLSPLQQSVKAHEQAYSNWTDAGNLWDGNTASEAVDLDNPESYVEYDFGSVRTIKQARFYESNSGDRQATDWKVQQWDGSAFVDLFPYVNSDTTRGQLQTFDVSTNKIRLYVRNTNPGGHPAATEFQVMAPIPQKNIADGATKSADSGWTNINALWEGNSVTSEAYTSNSEGYVEYDFGVERALTEARFLEDNAGDSQATEWKVQQWNGTAFVDMFPYINSETAQWQIQSINGSTSKIRLFVRNTNAAGYAAASGFKIMTADTSIDNKLVWSAESKEKWVTNGIVAIPNGTSVPDLILVSDLMDKSDSVFALAYSVSDDLGDTWSERTMLPYQRRMMPNGFPGILVNPIPVYHEASGKVIILGVIATYDSDTQMGQYPGYAYYDPATDTFSSDFYIMDYPATFAVSGGAIPYIADNGDIYWPIRAAQDAPNETYNSIRIAKLTFDGTTLTYVSQSEEIYGTGLLDGDGGRGGGEAHLTKSGNTYYLAIRDNPGYPNKTAISTDLSNWSTPVDLAWDDGTPVTGASNTQIRWITHSNDLYLTYTRHSTDPDNTAVYRNRAPIWIAKFDTATQRIIRGTERILINMNGDGQPMGSGFSVTNATQETSFLATAELYSGRTMVARLNWDTPNALATVSAAAYVLDEPWDSLTGWTKSSNPVITPSGQVNIYSTDGLSQYVYRTDKSIPGVYTLKWRVKVNHYTPTYGTSVLRVYDGAHLLQLGMEKNGIDALDNTNAWGNQKVIINDYKWHEIQVYVVNGKAEVFLDGTSQFTYMLPANTDADRITLYSIHGDFNTDELKIW